MLFGLGSGQSVLTASLEQRKDHSARAKAITNDLLKPTGSNIGSCHLDQTGRLNRQRANFISDRAECAPAFATSARRLD
jgi:hypothetical protein